MESCYRKLVHDEALLASLDTGCRSDQQWSKVERMIEYESLVPWIFGSVEERATQGR